MAFTIPMDFPKILTVGSTTEPEMHIATENSFSMGTAMDAQLAGMIRFFT